MSNHPLEIFPDLRKVAHDLRKKLESKDYIFFFAHNNAGKTRLSMEFKSIGEQKSSQDTLYFNAFTEDLFRWINDDANSNNLQNIFFVSNKSYFFNNLNELLPLESHVRQLIARHVDFDFDIDYNSGKINFFRKKDSQDNPIAIRISRGEENIFV